jgi:hypothetical protein
VSKYRESLVAIQKAQGSAVSKLLYGGGYVVFVTVFLFFTFKNC